MLGRIMMTVQGRTRPLTLSSAPGASPLLNSAATDWAGLPLEMHRFRTIEKDLVTGPVKDEHGLLVIMNGKVDLITRRDSREKGFSLSQGALYLLSGNDPVNVVRMAGNADAAAIHIPNDWFGRLLLDRAPTGFGRLEPLNSNQTTFSLVCAMREEIANGSTSGRLFAESISTALLSYIIERLPSACYRVRGRLSETQCRRLQRYIRDHLEEDLSLSDLANVAKISTRYLSTLFREAFGITPHQYVIRCRLAEGARLLAGESQDIADIALSLGFSSQSHFTVAFKRAYGMAPKQYAIDKRKRFSFVQPR